MVQKLMMQQAVDQKGARYITDTLWMLMESGTEEVKVLQSVTLLLTTNTVVHGDTLARVCIILRNVFLRYFFSMDWCHLFICMSVSHWKMCLCTKFCYCYKWTL